jgi:hypothetical protein
MYLLQEPNATRLLLLLICRRAKSPQVVIDLTLSDDEDVDVKPPNPRHSAHASTLLIDVPPVQQSLPMITTNVDHKSRKKDSLWGMNYEEKHPPLVPSIPIPSAAVPNLTQPLLGSRSAASWGNRKSALRPSANLEDLSSRNVQMNGPLNLANTAKRRKTTHDGVPLGGQRMRGTRSISQRTQVPPRSTSQSTNQSLDLTFSPPIAHSRTVITRATRLRTSYGTQPSHGSGLVQDSIALENQENHSMAILQEVFELIKRVLQPYQKELSLADQKGVTAKVQKILNFEIFDH